jgi:hypothetical protein
MGRQHVPIGVHGSKKAFYPMDAEESIRAGMERRSGQVKVSGKCLQCMRILLTLHLSLCRSNHDQ